MTISHDPPSKPTVRSAARQVSTNHWRLQDAKARFSELVRRVRSDGPQRVTVHGRDEVVVVSAEEYARLQGEPSGAALVTVMQASPHRDVDLAVGSVRAPVRAVEL